MIGSTTKTDGSSITAEGKAPVLTGITSGNTIDYIGRNKDKDGNYVSSDNGQFKIVITQPNGATLSQVGFEPKAEWATAIDILNQQMMHICTRVLSKEEYEKLCEDGGGDFNKFFDLIEARVLPLLKKAKWHCKIVLTESKDGTKFYPKLAKYPNFIELDNGTAPTTISDSLAKGESYVADYSKVAVSPVAPAGNDSDNPFE